MISLEEALARLLAGLKPNPSVPFPLLNPSGPRPAPTPRFLASDLTCPLALPPFDNSAVDGYAVRAADTSTLPAILRITGESAAGQPTPPALQAGQAVRIFTGAPIPPGADAVIMQEDCETDSNGTVAILDPVKPWENIRFAGEDIRSGTRIGRAGQLLTPQLLALLQSAGLDSIPVHTPATVALVGCGSELRPPGQPLPPGCIHESNLGPLSWLIAGSGAQVIHSSHVPDDPDATRAALELAASSAQVIVTVGGASVGDHDLIKEAAIAIGFDLDFWRIAMKPGKPFFCGRRDRTYLLGLPGNPVAAFVTTVLLVLPALRQLAGATDTTAPTQPGILTTPLTNPDRRRHFIRVQLDPDGSVRSTGTQASHILSSLAEANGLVDVPPQTTLAAGTVVRVVRW